MRLASIILASFLYLFWAPVHAEMDALDDLELRDVSGQYGPSMEEVLYRVDLALQLISGSRADALGDLASRVFAGRDWADGLATDIAGTCASQTGVCWARARAMWDVGDQIEDLGQVLSGMSEFWRRLATPTP
ncbi:MAG: hypothetical protein SVU69_00550 [Pseudomonadota bacterium]|nr:hypothetical protein [Pseudomonadota bacterium]